MEWEARQEWRDWMAQNLMALMIITVDESSKDGCTIFHCRGQAAYGQRATIDADFVCGE